MMFASFLLVLAVLDVLAYGRLSLAVMVGRFIYDWMMK